MDQCYIKSLSDQALIKSTERVVEQERKIVQVVIWHLQEIQDRKLFLTMEYVDMYECLIGHFKMSDTTAYGRIKVLKILEEVPHVSESLKTGELNISNLALAHSFFEKHQKQTGEALSSNDKAELMENLKNKTTAEVKELLAKCNPDMALPYDEIRPLTESHSQMRSTISKDLVKKFEYLKSLISHENINPTHEELLTMAVDALIEKVEKKKGLKTDKLARVEMAPQRVTVREMPIEVVTAVSDGPRSVAVKSAAAKATQRLTDGNSRYVPKNIKRMVFKRAQGKCEHTYASGKRCSSQFQTQFDHVIAFSKGGQATFENMQLLCRVHNAAKGDE